MRRTFGIRLALTLLALSLPAWGEEEPAAANKLELGGERKVLRFGGPSNPAPFRPRRTALTLSGKRPEGAPPVPEGVREPRHGMLVIAGVRMHLLLGKVAEGVKAPDLLAIDIDGDGAFSDEERWSMRPREKKVPGGDTLITASMAYLRVVLGETTYPIGFNLSLRPGYPLSAYVTPLWYLAATFEHGGKKLLVSVHDGDMDGTFDEMDDLWVLFVARPRSRAVSHFAMSMQDESRFLEGARFRLRGLGNRKLSLTIEPAKGPDPRDVAKQRDRATAFWSVRFDREREGFAKENGLDLSRPRADAPVGWRHLSFADGSAIAMREGKPVLVALWTLRSTPCWRMEYYTYSDREVAALIESRFVPVRIFEEQDVAGDYPRLRESLGRGHPMMGVFSAEGELLRTVKAFKKPEELLAELRAALEKPSEDD